MPGDVTVTLSGFVATTPTLFRSQSGNDFTSFRIAQTRRYLDRERGEWVDGRTLWFTVKAWKHVARNVALSLHKGDPVVVTGRLSLDEWDGPDGPRTSLVVEATALGPDLTLGEARFARTVHRREDDGARRGEATGRRRVRDRRWRGWGRPLVRRTGRHGARRHRVRGRAARRARARRPVDPRGRRRGARG